MMMMMMMMMILEFAWKAGGKLRKPPVKISGLPIQIRTGDFPKTKREC
jgi:hypothetical protein